MGVTCHSVSCGSFIPLDKVNTPSKTDRHSTYLPRRDGRLSWCRWLVMVTFRHGLPVYRSNKTVVTGPGVEQLRETNPLNATPDSCHYISVSCRSTTRNNYVIAWMWRAVRSAVVSADVVRRPQLPVLCDVCGRRGWSSMRLWLSGGRLWWRRQGRRNDVRHWRTDLRVSVPTTTVRLPHAEGHRGRTWRTVQWWVMESCTLAIV